MKLEELCKFILTNWNLIQKNKAAKKKFWILFMYWINLLEWHKKKRRPGKVGFEFKCTFFENVLLDINVEFKFIRQNTYEEDQQKLEVVLDRQGWKNNFKDNLAMCPVILIISWELYKAIYEFYQLKFPYLAFRSEFYDFILQFGFNTALKVKFLGSFESWAHTHYWITDLLIDFCINFNIIF